MINIKHLNDHITSFCQLLYGYRTRSEKGIADVRTKDISPYLEVTNRENILDLANGRLRPQYSILFSEGNSVIGVDRVNIVTRNIADIEYRFARWLYSLHLRNKSGVSKPDKLICSDVSNLPIKSCYFDLVTSVAAFEHFLDVPAVVEEIGRVLRPGGLVWVSIHPFTCLSGGHNLSLTEIPLQKVPKGIDPWDHLRKRRLSFTVPLNEWRIPQYKEIFSRHFELLNCYCALHEGEHLISEEIKKELAEYSREELTCCTYIIVARKPES